MRMPNAYRVWVPMGADAETITSIAKSQFDGVDEFNLVLRAVK